MGVDIFGDSPASRLHFNGLEKHQSYVGGYCTLLMIISIIAIIFAFALPIFIRKTPYNTSITMAFDEDEEILYDEANKILISI